ncbi:MAG: hypothetical protein WC496_01060 [Phycisphaerae bacterium]
MKDKRKLLSYGVALICWILSAGILFILAANSKLNILRKQFENCNFQVTLPTNRLDSFSYTRFDSEKNYRPTYAIAFENLRLENNSFGPFKTAMYKKAMIRDLELRFYRYTPAAKGESVNIGEHLENQPPSVSLASDISSIDIKELIGEAADILTNPSNRYSIGNINFANVSEVYANNFDCGFYHENDLSLSIRCRRAAVSYKNYNMELRGHVIIKTEDGTTLESNFVEWDIRNNVFRVNNMYVLNHNGNVKTGTNACFDFGLNKVLSHQAVNGTKEKHKCIAKL